MKLATRLFIVLLFLGTVWLYADVITFHFSR